MKDIKTYIKDTAKINAKKPITSENLENRNDKRIINEGLFSSGCPGWFDDLFAPFKSFFFNDNGKEKDDRTEYQKALDNARASKLDQIKNQRKALKAQKDKIKAETVNAKSEYEKNHLKLAHEHQMAQLQAQIDMLKDQKNRWKENKSRLTKEEYEYGLHQYEKQIADVKNTEEKSDEEKKKELLLNLVYEYNQETGELEYIGNDTEKIKNALKNNPDLKNELKTAYAGNNEALGELSPENIKDLAENMTNSTEEAIKQNDNYIAAQKTAIQEGERALSEIASISEKRLAGASKNVEEIDKIDANINQKKKLLGLNFNIEDSGDNNLNDLLSGFTPSDSDNDDDKKAAAKTHIVKELKEMGIDLSDSDIPDNLISINDGKVKIPNNLTDVSGAKEFIDEINSKKEKKIDSINTFLEENKSKAVELGYKKEQIESAKNADKADMNAPEKPEAQAQEYTEEERESIASALGYTKNGEKWEDKDKNEIDLAEKIKNPNSLKDVVKAKKEELESKKEALKKVEDEKEKRSSEIKTQVKDAKAAFAERENQRADSKFAKEVEAAKNDYIPGTTKNDNGKIGYYDGEEFKERPSKDDPDFKEKIKEWEKGRVKAILEPSKKQKEKLDTGDTVKIKIKKDDDNNVKYYKVDIDGNPTECSRDEALETEKKLMAKKETDIAKKAAETAFAKGKPYDGVEKNPVESDKQSKDNEVELLNDDGEKTGEKIVRKEDGSYVKVDKDDKESDATEEEFNDAKSEYEEGDGDEENSQEDNDADKDLDTDYEESDDEKKSDEGKKAERDESGKRVNPAKNWHKRKKKNGGGSTKSYYNSKGESISAKEFREKMENYKAYVQKHKKSTQQNSNFNISNFLKNKLIVERFYPRDITNYLKEHLR